LLANSDLMVVVSMAVWGSCTFVKSRPWWGLLLSGSCYWCLGRKTIWLSDTL